VYLRNVEKEVVVVLAVLPKFLQNLIIFNELATLKNLMFYSQGCYFLDSSNDYDRNPKFKKP
jgi:hypothetical protein